MEEEEQQVKVSESNFTDDSDLCQQLMDRYGKSSAPQHRHLCASAAAIRSILQDEKLGLTPQSYFAATISSIDNASETLESNAIAALSSFLSILLPLVPSNSIPPPKAVEAISVLVKLLKRPSNAVSASTLRCLVKCLGVLAGFCDLEDWNSVKLLVETLLDFSIDKRPKVRRCAQICLERIFKSVQCSFVIKDASNSVLSLLRIHLPLTVELNALRTMKGSKDESLSKSEHLEVLHMLNVVRLIVPCLSVNVRQKVLSEMRNLLNSEFSAVTRHIFYVIEAILETSSLEVPLEEVEEIIVSLASYISLVEKNPMDTVMSAASLLKCSLEKVRGEEFSTWSRCLSLVVKSLAGLLTSESGTASQASNLLKEIINCHIHGRNFSTDENHSLDGDMDTSALKSACIVFEKLLVSVKEIPNQHTLAVVSVLFLKLDKRSHHFGMGLVLKLADLMTLASKDKSDTKHVEECIGYAVTALGPEKILELLPISLNADDLTCSNIWLINVLKKYIIGSSLGFYIENIVPLSKSLKRASRKAKKFGTGEDLQTHAYSLLGLLPAFCRYPIDTQKKFGSLAKLLIKFLKKISFMHEDISVALQELVHQNKDIIRSDQDSDHPEHSRNNVVEESPLKFRSVSSYTKKVATRNIKTLASCSEELLECLIDVFFDSPPEKSSCLKGAIGCLASITDSSVTRKIFVSSLERFELVNGVAQFENLSHIPSSFDISTTMEKDAHRCLVMELASSLVEGANEDLIDLIYKFIKHTLQAGDEVVQHEAYCGLSSLLEGHSDFCSVQFAELMDMLLGLKSPVNVTTLKSRFAVFQNILVCALKTTLEEDNTKAFLILNEIILKLKDSKDEVRKIAYDVLLRISSSLRNSSGTCSDGPHRELISMIMGYFSGSSPHIKSGAVSALSVLVYKDADMCVFLPDILPSVLALLQSKSVEVIKAVLGFVKVLVSCMQAKDLQNLLPDIASGILPWSSNSRHHFRTKIIIILEIMIRKCGSSAVRVVTPEKYREFVKSVLENRHARTHSKGASGTDTEQNITDPYWRGSLSRPKRTGKELHTSVEEKSSMKSRKRGKKMNKHAEATGSNENVLSTGSGNGMTGFSKASHSKGRSTKTWPNHNVMEHKSGGKRKMEQRKFGKNIEAVRRHKKIKREKQKSKL